MRAFRSIPALAAVLAALAAAPASAQAFTETHFAAVMDQVFGRGAWRLTGGYRTPERENQLRAQGAMTVRPGGVSRHSLGRPGAPGAYDLVVNGMSPFEAADRLRRAGAPFARYQPKGAHGTQGPHLHLEPYGFGPALGGGFQVASAPAPKVEEGRRRSAVIRMPAAGPRRLAEAREDFRRLQAAADSGAADAQLELGRAYVLGYAVARDFGEAYAWLAAAADNPAAGPEVRAEAMSTLGQLPALMAADQQDGPARYAELRTGEAGR